MRTLIVVLLLFFSPGLYSQTLSVPARAIRQASEKTLFAPLSVRPAHGVVPELSASSSLAVSLHRAVHAAQAKSLAASCLPGRPCKPLLSRAPGRAFGRLRPLLALSPRMVARHRDSLSRLDLMTDQQLVDEWILSAVFLYAWQTEMPFFEWPHIEKVLAEHEWISWKIRSRKIGKLLRQAPALASLPERAAQVLPCGRSVFWEEFVGRRIIRMPDGSLATPLSLMQDGREMSKLEEWMTKNSYEHSDLEKLSRVDEAEFQRRFEAWRTAALAQVGALEILEQRLNHPYWHSSFSFDRLAALEEEMSALEHLTNGKYERWVAQPAYSAVYRAVAGRVAHHYNAALKSLDILADAQKTAGQIRAR